MNWKKANQAITSANRIALMTHENPDGDGLGCAAAFHHYLNTIQCENRIIINGDFPVEYNFLNNDDIFESYSPELHIEWLKKVDLVIVFDIGDIKRLNSIKEVVDTFDLPIMNIDHHPTVDSHIFKWNFIDIEAAATGEMLFEYFEAVGFKDYSKDIFNGLYTAVLTDTGSFRYSNTSIRSHKIAIESMRYGVDHTRIYQDIYESKSRHWIKLLGAILSTLKYEFDGQLGWFIIDKKMLNDSGASYSDIDGFTDFVRTINGVEISIMLVENENETCRINFRSKGKYVVNNVAKMFNGGGHKFAAGAIMNGKITEIAPLVIKETIDSMNNQNLPE